MVEQFRPRPPQESSKPNTPSASERVKKVYEDPLILEAVRKHNARKLRESKTTKNKTVDILHQPEVEAAVAQRKMDTHESLTIESANKTLNDPLVQEALRKKRSQN